MLMSVGGADASTWMGSGMLGAVYIVSASGERARRRAGRPGTGRKGEPVIGDGRSLNGESGAGTREGELGRVGTFC
jgi:hypothetical protein